MSAFTTRRVRGEKEIQRWARIAAWGDRLRRCCVQPLLGWYRAYRERVVSDERTHRMRRILIRIALILAGILACLFLLAATVKALIAAKILGVHTLFSVAGQELPTDEDGYTNFLLLGRGDETHDGTDLTDTIMVASIDPDRTRSAVLLSIPRDLFLLDSKKLARGRVNELYRDYKNYLKRTEGISADEASKRAMRELADEMSRRLKLRIHHVIMVDFTAFVEGVDALGGIDIEVPQDIVDTSYPGPNYTYETFEIRSGPQHMDGETALKYARSRHTTSDFDRSARQQQLVAALGEKARSEGFLSPGRVTTFWKILADHVETTLSAGEALGLARAGGEIDRDRIISIQLNNETGFETGLPAPGGFLYNPPRDQFDGASVLLPVSIPEFPVTWKQIQAFSTLLFRMRSIYLSRPQIFIYNAGAQSGLGRRLAEELTRYGLPVAEIGNFPGFEPRKKDTRRPTSAIVARTDADRNLALFFATLLHLPLLDADPSLSPEDAAQVTIVLGEDYAYRPLQNLLLLPP